MIKVKYIIAGKQQTYTRHFRGMLHVPHWATLDRLPELKAKICTNSRSLRAVKDRGPPLLHLLSGPLFYASLYVYVSVLWGQQDGHKPLRKPASVCCTKQHTDSHQQGRKTKVTATQRKDTLWGFSSATSASRNSLWRKRSHSHSTPESWVNRKKPFFQTHAKLTAWLFLTHRTAEMDTTSLLFHSKHIQYTWKLPLCYFTPYIYNTHEFSHHSSPSMSSCDYLRGKPARWGRGCGLGDWGARAGSPEPPGPLGAAPG